jgi:DNA-binding NarL/FixJ family response regulator
VSVPIVFVEGPREALDHAVAELSAAGWEVSEGFDGLPPGRRRLVRRGVVRSAEDAAAALLAVLDGAGVVIAAEAPREILDRLLDDLRHVGPVDHRIGEFQAPPAMTPEARAILGLLAEGETLGEAAELLGLSRRTADRRLAEARAALGVERTAQAIARAKRLGWLRRPSAPGGA